MVGNRRSAAVVSLNENIKEIEDLANSANIDVLYELIQKRKYPDPSTFIGKGKVNDLRETLERRHVDVLLFNGDLKPSQHFNLERSLGIECIDRVRLVLNIFKERANTAESMLQVERATLKYEIPFLREWIHNAKSGERPGFLAGGEYAIDVYYDLIRKRMNVIESKLSKLDRGLTQRREQRKKKGFNLICLAGYTNAGKSSLLNVLANDTALVDNKMFSTLSARTRTISNARNEILLTDTIGFLENLPYFMIESFKYTMNEIFSADLVLLVVDCSDSVDEMMRKVDSSIKILSPEVDSSRMIVVLNKTDLDSPSLEKKTQLVREATGCAEVVPVSARTGQGIEDLMESISSHFREECEIELALPNLPDLGKIVSWLYEAGTVRRIDYGGEVRLTIGCRDELKGQIVEKTKALGGRVIDESG